MKFLIQFAITVVFLLCLFGPIYTQYCLFEQRTDIHEQIQKHKLERPNCEVCKYSNINAVMENFDED